MGHKSPPLTALEPTSEGVPPRARAQARKMTQEQHKHPGRWILGSAWLAAR